jgi:phosphotransferase system enzyme I (PtsI)
MRAAGAPELRRIAAPDVDAETQRYRAAVTASLGELESVKNHVAACFGESKAAIFEAQQLMLQDSTLDESVSSRISGDLVCAEHACISATEAYAQVLAGLEDKYLSERAQDVRDIGKRLVRRLMGVPDHDLRDLPQDSVIVAADLAPSSTATLDTSRVVGMVLDGGGATCHTAILARSLGIPAVVATRDATSIIRDVPARRRLH